MRCSEGAWLCVCVQREARETMELLKALPVDVVADILLASS